MDPYLANFQQQDGVSVFILMKPPVTWLHEYTKYYMNQRLLYMFLSDLFDFCLNEDKEIETFMLFEYFSLD